MMLNNMQKKPYCSQRGAIMVFFTLLLPILFGFMGLGFDVSMLYVNKGKLQNVADAAALAGAAHMGEEGDGIRHAVEAFANANGLQVSEQELVPVTDGDMTSLAELADSENLRVAYGIATVNEKPRLRVRIDKRVHMPFISVLLPDLEKGMPVVAVAAAEGGAVEVPPFRIIGRNGVYDHFFNLSGSKADGEPDKWVDGSVYAGNMLRVSYKTKNPADAKNMFSINGYIFADMLHTGLPLKYGTSNDKKNPSDDRIIRSEYVRKKDGDSVLTGFEALTPSSFMVPEWNCTAQEKAEQELQNYSAILRNMIGGGAGSIKQKAMNKEDGYRYMCNQAVKDELDAKNIVVKDLLFERVKVDTGKEDNDYKKKTPEYINHQYSNIEVGREKIDVLYIEMQGDWKGQDLQYSREGAVWLGAYPKTDQLKEVGLLIVELKTEPNEEQKNQNLTADDLTGSFIICPGITGCKFGAIYSQANLEIRAAYRENVNQSGGHNSFEGPIFSEKFLSFSYDDKCGGKGFANPSFGKDCVIAANIVLFGYGYEIGRNVVVPGADHMGTHYYDDLTNYKTDTSTGDFEKKWWESGIKTVDEWYDNNSNQTYSMSDFNFHDDTYLEQHPEVTIDEVALLTELWQAIDCRDKTYKEHHNREINLKGSLYGDYGRWPTEFGRGGGSDGNSTLRMCSFGEREGTETITTKLRLVE